MLYLNGKSIMNAPLHQRLRALDAALLKDNQSHIDTISIAPRKTVTTKEEVETLFSKALGAGEEGIVVKRKDVPYQPGTRSVDCQVLLFISSFAGNAKTSKARIRIELMWQCQPNMKE
ncbi:hypothetical protein TELCIR_13641 [Teladorsagia circumcincta]|uniref:ATP-dependent DNA ligase family profile domain-containing protein n=1 Tax=Teladorsagia circumcincta TaxID=45464 RepID=A0A2G9U5C1_TELCI|nr:hypothetical protein TELCIR_13641 [Teladorsagia circumcincta]